MGHALLDDLARVVGAAHVLVEDDARAPYETDWTRRFHGRARCVVRPATLAELVAVMRVCHAARMPVVPQGGNTGLVGGGVPRGGEVLVSLQRMDDVGPVDAAVGEVIVGAGATLGRVRDAARRAGWDVGVDLAARDSATIGGMVSTNAGGTHVLRYGPMRDQVLGLEAVLADGSVVGRVPALRKDNTGYHWPGLLAGSEGTLALVARVHLALVPHLTGRVVALFGVGSVADALALCGGLRRHLDALVALEGMFGDGVALVAAHAGLPMPFPEPVPVYVLAECAGAPDATDGFVDALADAADRASVVIASAVASDSPGRDRLWSYRERHSEAIAALGIAHKLDVTLPFDRLPAFEREVRALVADVAPGARAILFGHLGDGNLHVNVVGPPPDDATVDEAVLGLVVEMGGSISAEHGIGVAKRAYVARARSAADLAAMAAIKHALDPDDLLNPGVLLP